MIIQFVLIGEGSSDNALVSHLENLCLEASADEVTGTSLDFAYLPASTPRTVAGKLRVAMQLFPNINLYFIHRDADARDPQPRHDEITAGVQEALCLKPCIAVVPVQETEAWLLLDEPAIRLVVNKTHGRRPLGLPALAAVERTANPKELLQNALIIASERTGEYLQKLKADFPRHRRNLLERLPTDGPVRNLASWQRMRTEIGRVIDEMKNALASVPEMA